VGRRPCLTPSETAGYLLDEAEVTFWGLCPDCQAGSATAAGATAVKKNNRPTQMPAMQKEATP
jgi:hypothetical protein